MSIFPTPGRDYAAAKDAERGIWNGEFGMRNDKVQPATRNPQLDIRRQRTEFFYILYAPCPLLYALFARNTQRVIRNTQPEPRNSQL